MKNLIVALALVTMSTQSWAWGIRGHETVNTAAVKLLPDSPFSRLMKKNIIGVRFIAMTPDFAWKHGSEVHRLEGEAHFFSYDFYSHHGVAPLNPDINYYIGHVSDPEIIVKKGTAPWRIAQMANLLVKVLRKRQVNEIEVVQIASALGHYVGDLGNPLHVAEDYDGVKIGDKGLHKFFETETVDSIPEDTLLESVTRLASTYVQHIPESATPLNSAFVLAKGAFQNSKVVLADTRRLGLTSSVQTRFKPIIVTSMAMSTVLLAKIWNDAYVAAGSPKLSVVNLGKLPVPKWVPVNYITGVKPE